MALARIKGQEVEILLVVNGEIQSALTDIQSFEFNQELETTEEGYLGEKGNRYDEFYKGYSGSVSLHNHSPDLFTFFDFVKDRAQRREPGTIVNIKATLNYPSGERQRVLLQDAFFDTMGLSFGSRSEYGATTLNFKGTEFRHI